MVVAEVVCVVLVVIHHVVKNKGGNKIMTIKEKIDESSTKSMIVLVFILSFIFGIGFEIAAWLVDNFFNLLGFPLG